MAEKWSTFWLGAYGALAGLMWATLKSAPLWHLGGGYGALAAGQMLGGLVAGGVLIASVVELRNLMLRR